MKNPITKLRLDQLKNTYSELKLASSPKSIREETLFIKFFEIAYEISLITLKNLFYYETNNLNLLSNKEVLRWAFKANIIKNIDNWLKYLHLRNRTVHEYIGDEIYEETKYIYPFLNDFEILISNLEKYYLSQKQPIV